VSTLRPRRSAAWSVVWRVGYRFLRLLGPVLEWWIARGLPGLDRVVGLRTMGRRTGRARESLITLLTVDGRSYVGHPNGPAAWTRNIQAAGWVEVVSGRAIGRYAVHRLPDGPERDDVIRATWRQQPFPANLLYRAAARHVAAAGEYHRLEPLAVPTDGNTG
jgi:deazaflavin-dependent oxidoreductase (nitroreductase family)